MTSSGHGWKRRDVLKSLAVVAGTLPASAFGQDGPPRRRVGIVGAGMAGVSLAWLLDGQVDVVLLEARDVIGGNVRAVDVELDGHVFTVDIGAQYFHPGPYPTYTTLLTQLGLFPPVAGAPAGAHAFPASITVTAQGETRPRFVSPILPGRAWPVVTGWNFEGLVAFAVGFGAARARELAGASWNRTLGDWLPTLGLEPRQWEGMLLPWAASLFSGRIDQARDLSARAAMIFAALALPKDLLAPLQYFVVNPGLDEALRRMLAQCTTVQVETGAVVQRVTRLRQAVFGTPAHGRHGPFRVQCADGRVVVVDDLVLAASGPGSLRVLNTLPGTAWLRTALAGIEFFDARLALHTDPVYGANPFQRSFLNCDVQGDQSCEASMWMADVLTAVPRQTAAKVWKSWVTHRDVAPAAVLHEATFQHMLPTVASIAAQNVVRTVQGRDGVWLAGGYLHPYDSQETALQSALDVVEGLGVPSARADALRMP
jgi:predicted NAD/FAD-binding protein